MENQNKLERVASAESKKEQTGIVVGGLSLSEGEVRKLVENEEKIRDMFENREIDYIARKGEYQTETPTNQAGGEGAYYMETELPGLEGTDLVGLKHVEYSRGYGAGLAEDGNYIGHDVFEKIKEKWDDYEDYSREVAGRKEKEIKESKEETRKREMRLESKYAVPVINGKLCMPEEGEPVDWTGKYYFNIRTKRICWKPDIKVQYPEQLSDEEREMELTDDEIALEKELARQSESEEWAEQRGE